MPTARNMNTTANMGHPVNIAYQKAFLSRRMPLMLYAMFGMPYSIPANEGDTIMWDRFANPTAQTTPLTEGEDPRPIQQSRTTITARVREFGAWLKCSSWMEVTAPHSYTLQKTEWLSDQSARTLDTVCRDTLVGTASSQTCANGDPTATMINETDILTVTETMLTNEARQISPMIDAGTGQGTSPAMRSFVIISNTALRNDYFNADGFLKISQYGSGKARFPGEEGQLGDCAVLLTTDGAVSGSNYQNLIIGTEAYGNVKLPANDKSLIFHGPAQVGSALERFSTYGWKQTYAARILRDEWIQNLICTRGSRTLS